MDEIRLRTAEGCKLRDGGVEVGGVLFGTRGEGALRILTVRPIECEYAHGGEFILSNRDETGPDELLQACGADPALAGLEPAGYYRSQTAPTAQTGEKIRLSEADMQLFDHFFPLPWQVVLVVRPAELAPTRAAFFFREEDGTVRTESSDSEFDLTVAAEVC
jgi:hypothetical protein